MTGAAADVPAGSGGASPGAPPSGTVTLLFSDIEGSTGLAHSLGESWPIVLERQRAVCRAVWTAHGGVEMGTEGDCFFVVFSTAHAGLSAAIAAQRSLAGTTWADGAVVRVRMGVHTGSPLRLAEGYAGLDVHRAARVAAAAHGGQVLVSSATAELARVDLDGEVALLDLGEHRLKDIPHPVRLHQVAAPGLAREFPPPRTLGGAGGLPPTLTPTVGRSGELAELESIVVRDRGRLVTLTGPGGTGKTRLAIALAERVAPDFPDGVHFVPLTAVTTPAAVWAAIAGVLDVPAEGHAPPAFFDHVAQLRCLLVLDNLEQIRDIDHVVRELITGAPQVSVVATSRRALHVDGEYDHAVPPLVLPRVSASYGEIESSGAAQLFVDQARRAKRDFRLTPENATDVAALCRALDGLPLAIELAAARVKLLSCRAILARIDQALDLVHTDRSRPTRQQTIRQAIAWSYDLLEAPQQAALRALAVFDDGATLAALDRVVAGSADLDTQRFDLVELLYDLIDASLVRVVEADDGEPRFLLLQTIRRFALDRSAAVGELDRAYRQHSQYFYDLAVAWKGEERSGDLMFRRAVLAEISNLSAVVARATPGVRDQIHDGAQDVPARQVAFAFCGLAVTAGRAAVADRWAQAGLQTRIGTLDPHGTAGLFQIRAQVAYRLGDNAAAVSHAPQAVASLGQTTPASIPHPWLDPHSIAARAVNVWANALMDLGDFDRASEVIDDLDARLSEVTELDIDARMWAGELRYLLAESRGDRPLARDLLAAHVAAMAAIGPLPMAQHIRYQNNLADADTWLGNLPEAQQRLRDLTPVVAEYADLNLVLLVAATFAGVVATSHPLLCARVFGATAATRIVEAMPDTEWGITQDEQVMATARALVTPEEWQAAFDRGRSEQLADLLAEMAALPPVPAADAESSR